MKKKLIIFLKKIQILKTQQKAKDFSPLKTKIINKLIKKYYRQNISIYWKMIKKKKIKT